MSDPIRGKYESHENGGYAMDGTWDNDLSRMRIGIEGESGMFFGTEVDIYPAGEPRYTEKEYAEKLHSMLQSVEEAQEDALAISALVADMLMVDNEDVPVFGVLQNINDMNESFEEENYAIGATPTKAIAAAIAKVTRKSFKNFEKLGRRFKSALEELQAAIESFSTREDE